MANQVWNRLNKMTSDYKEKQQTTPTLTSKQLNEKYPGLTQESYKKMVDAVDKLGLSGAAKENAMNTYYRNNVKFMVNDQTLQERDSYINQQALEAANLNNKQADAQLRMTEFSQALKKKYNLNAKANDLDVFSNYVSDLGEEGVNLAGQYLSGENKKLRYDAGLESGWEKVADFGVGVAQSPGKRGYNMVGQWMDKLGKAVADKLEGTDLQKRVQDKAIEAFGEDEVRAFAEQRQKELAEGTAFKGREATDIRTPLLGEERANNGWTKAGEIVGDIGTAIAMSYPLSAALAPAMATQGVGNAALLGGIEGGIDTLVTHYGSQGNLDVTPTEAALGIVGGAGGGVLTNKLANLGTASDKIDDVVDKTDDVSKSAKEIKLTNKIADKTDDANRIAGRIGQGDIDDQAKVVEGVKSITKRSGEKGVKTIKKYGELKDAIKSTEKQIISQEDDLLRQFPDKITDWTTTETVRGLGDQVDDVTRDYLDDGIELLKKYNKNDPVAMKELEMLQNTKNTEGLTRLEAKELARKLGAKLSKKFYNSNDELRNSMSAESYEQIRKGIQNAVRDRLPDDVLKNLDLEYSNLKAFEGLTDDMAEKVNTLTQKIKATGPIEKLGRKVGDVINRVTGKGIKGLVEKFLPSNMGNKINNSIDMEIELSKNLGKLVKLNDAIDVLNTSLNSQASKSAINTALRNFANVVSDIKASITPTAVNTTTRGINATANVLYNNQLDKE